ncbi:MAG TPA: YggS family pyridoxal phosphate-dependent enzyme [Fodinibius sp.]|nr:YggS family pyridoxal phosphate-dependent enzyme [Fodinibius sp.]
MSNLIQRNIQHVRDRITQACQRVGRDPQNIKLLLVTKTVEPERIREAVRYGLTQLGENRVQEARRKVKQMKGDAPPLNWHFIGHLQSNKVNKVVRFASMVQSIDRMKIVRKMNRRLKKVDKRMDVLVQVNVSGEESKYGFHPDQTVDFIREASDYPLNIRGLMTIGLFSKDWPKVRAGFRRLRELRDEVAAKDIEGVAMDYLSMGMTNDFEIAIEEGANMIRVGRAVFGERDHPDSYYWPGIEETAS